MDMIIKSGSVTINGVSYVGNNINVKNGVLSIDNVVQTATLENIVNIVINGDCGDINNTQGTVEIRGKCENIKTVSGDVNCSDVQGSVQTVSGDVKAKNVNGYVKTVSGDIYK